MNTHGICQTAQAHEPCTVCHAAIGCACRPGRGTHLCRICLAAHDGHITMGDAASVIQDADVFTGASLVLDLAAAS